ncbi:MAG: hypothetical protein P4N59_12790 [Negativicutes bacterium]|nr:hypothetical protein [Negativicutes bacterium]
MKKQIVRLVLGSALALVFTLPIAHVTFGDPTGDCHKRLEADRARIDHDVAKHGENSPQVNRDVARMDRDRNWCREHHADWDHDHFDVGIYFKH